MLRSLKCPPAWSAVAGQIIWRRSINRYLSSGPTFSLQQSKASSQLPLPSWTCPRTFITSSVLLDAFNFDKESEETLESLSEHFEELLQSAKGMEESDVSLSSGVLNVTIPDFGTYVINKQGPNKQIWLSSPRSGPARLVTSYE